MRAMWHSGGGHLGPMSACTRMNDEAVVAAPHQCGDRYCGLGTSTSDGGLPRGHLVTSRPEWGLEGLRYMLARPGVNRAADLVQSLQGLNSGSLSPRSVLYPYSEYAE